MSGFVEGIDRSQSSLFPAELEDYVAEDNPVRAVDAFVDGLDLGKLGFGRVVPLEKGRPCYHPATLLKIYIYGYLNRIPSSRRLERECQRNIELVWLTGQLAPDFKTIADFRKDNGQAIREVCRTFVALCRELDLLSVASVAIDGSKFKAVNARDKNFTEAKIEKLRDEIARLSAINAEMMKSEDKQISLTDPDARSMATSGKDTGIVGYNVQAAVDTKNHLIVAHEVTNVGTDRHQLSNIAEQARTEMGVETLDAVADRGYYTSAEILACEEAGITVTLPKPMTSNSKAEGRFGKQDFRYAAEEDVYICPAGERLAYHYTTEENGLVLRRYWTNACQSCAIKHSCTTSKERRVTRWEHEHVLEAVQRRLDEHPEKMRQRRETVEHPFGTIKARMGATHFLMKTLPRVAAEMALHVLAYNLTRVINILGVQPLMAVMRA